MQKANYKLSGTNKRKLFYSILLLVIPIILIIGLTLSWFLTAEHSFVDSLDFMRSGEVYKLYHSIDEDGDGLPDEDENGIIYVPANMENIAFSYLYPQHTTAFRLEITTGEREASILGILNSVCPPVEQYIRGAPVPLPDLDAADVLYIQYEKPLSNGGFQTVNAPLSQLFESGTRNIILFTNIIVPANSEFTLDYQIYMMPTAGNEYQGMRLIVEEAVFRTQH